MADDAVLRAINEAGAAYRETGAPFLPRFAALLVDRADLRPGNAVVDVATGPGTVVEPIVRAVGKSGSVIGVDLAERQLELGRAALAGVPTRVRFMRMDAIALDLADRSVSAVTCGFGLPYIHDPLRALREAARIARPGGAIACTTWREPFFGRPGERLLEIMERQEVPHLFRPFTNDPEEVARWCFRAGLRDVVIEEHDDEIVFPQFDDWWAMNRAFAFLARLDAVPLSRRNAVREELESDNTVVQADGSVTCALRVLLVRAIA